MLKRKPHLFLHVGTTKTGTTTLQHAGDASRESLLARGVLYPDIDLNAGPAPKHQWLANLLLTDGFDRFDRNVRAVLQQARERNASRVLLSTEGLYNHWFDFPQRGREALARLRGHFDVTVWVVFREPVSWTVSMYVQAVKNPPFHLAPVYATTEALDAVVDHPYFRTRLAYDHFVRDAEALFGEGSVRATRYEDGDILHQARKLLEVDADALASAGDRNRGLSVLGLDLLLRLNRLGLPNEERERIAADIVAVDRALGITSEPVRASAAVRDKVLAMTRDSERYLEQRFAISWADCR